MHPPKVAEDPFAMGYSMDGSRSLFDHIREHNV